jgi:DNA-binding NarL/FixJ family response regulator
MERKIKLLVCDDHTLFRQGIKASLGFYSDIDVIAEAGDGSQLMHMLKHMSPDIILLDINMPIMDGIESLTKIKSEYPDIKVIIVSMHNNASMISKMIALGANSYLTKGDTPDVIYEAIKKVYSDEFYFTPLMNKALLKSTQENDALKTMEIKLNTDSQKEKSKVIDKNAEILERIVQKLDEIDKRKDHIHHNTNSNTDQIEKEINWWSLISKTMIVLLMAAAVIFLIWVIARVRTESGNSQSSKLEKPKNKVEQHAETIEGNYSQIFKAPYNIFGR